jgi:tetratricopeptide (TPR) repeat protein
MFKVDPVIRISDLRKALADEHAYGETLVQISESSLDKSKMNESTNSLLSLQEPIFSSDSAPSDARREKQAILTPSTPLSSHHQEAKKYKFLSRFEKDDEKEQYLAYLFSLIDDGDRAFQRCHYQEASSYYQAAITSIFRYWNKTSQVSEIISRLQDLMLYAMESYFETDNFLAAVDLGKELIRQYPHDIRSYLALCFCYRANEDCKESIRLCNAALKLFPNDQRLFSLRGKAYYDHGEFKLALRDFDRSLELSRLSCGEAANHGKAMKSWLRDSVF